ncbi:MAG: ABC transporter permease [Lachnospiraceae bacterium]|jgi:cell division transport system permease protein|nr:ABC transporter permease [Lachnospiraceae bacterium]
MRISTFFYTIKQGFRNIFRNKLFSLASIATITACLFMFGIFYSVVVNLQSMVQNAEEGVCVTAFFEAGTDDLTMQEIGQKIAGRMEVSDVEYISADQAWEDWKADYPPEYAEGFTENPLENCANYRIYLSDVSMQDSLVTYLESMPEIRKVNRSQLTADVLTGFNSLLGYVSIGLIAILLGVSVFLISNTVTIGINVRREEITIMKYIGATDFFVRSPFVVEGILIGLVGAGIPLAIIYFVYNKAVAYVLDRFSILTNLLTFLPVKEIFHILLPLSLGIGVGIGFLGSFITVRKHLRV